MNDFPTSCQTYGGLQCCALSILHGLKIFRQQIQPTTPSRFCRVVEQNSYNVIVTVSFQPFFGTAEIRPENNCARRAG